MTSGQVSTIMTSHQLSIIGRWSSVYSSLIGSSVYGLRLGTGMSTIWAASVGDNGFTQAIHLCKFTAILGHLSGEFHPQRPILKIESWSLCHICLTKLLPFIYLVWFFSYFCLFEIRLNAYKKVCMSILSKA